MRQQALRGRYILGTQVGVTEHKHAKKHRTNTTTTTTKSNNKTTNLTSISNKQQQQQWSDNSCTASFFLYPPSGVSKATLLLLDGHTHSSSPHRFQHDPHSSTLWVSSVTILPSGVSLRGALNSGGYTRNAPNSGRPLARDRRGSTYNRDRRRGTQLYTSYHTVVRHECLGPEK